MEYSLYDFLRLIGSLGLFLFGMKLMSEALQKVAGDKMRNILGSMTSNRFKGMLTGILITAIIQSSSATTVLIVSFVNAGLLSLTESIGVIMGANIGTTVTAWMISLLGFKIDISAFALPLIGLSLPLLFSKKTKQQSIGELIIGFAILFMGLAYLNSSVPDINQNPDILSFFSKYSASGFWSILFFIVIGTVVTLILQSSSAAMALTLVMCFNGWIGFDIAVAMVLGQNIGTTITANIAALVANSTAKQAAMAHLIFNVIGVTIALILFKPFENMVFGIMRLFNLELPMLTTGHTIEEANAAMPLALSIYHTIFNTLNTLLLIWFVPQIVRIVKLFVRTKDEDDEVFKLKYITTSLLSVDEIALVQAKKEIGVFIERSLKMFNMLKEMADENTPNKKVEKVIKKIRKYEEISDRIEEEIATFLTNLSSSELSKKSSNNMNAMLKLVSRIESINDACYNTAELLYIKNSKKMKFTDDMNYNIKHISQMAEEIMYSLPKEIDVTNPKINILEFRNLRDDIDTYAEKLNIMHLKDIKKGKYKYKDGIIYCDIFEEIAIIANHAYHSLKYINDLTI